MSCPRKALKSNVQMKNSIKKTALKAFAKVQISQKKAKEIKGGTAEIIITELVES